MNCATHNDLAAVAFCRTCGKPLCSHCTRDVRGVVYCEPCLAARLDGTVASAAFVPPTQPVYNPVAASPAPPPPGRTSGPNPTVAGILAGFFPFGVGAVYCSQYAKGLAHLVIFALLIFGVSHAHSWGALFGLGISFFYVYQIIDSVRTARAIQEGLPAPDPLGFGQTFSMGEKFDSGKVPVGAVVLIGLGVLFLLHTMGLMEYGFERFWPFLLILLGGWMFYRNYERSQRAGASGACATRNLMGPTMVLTTGVVFMLDTLNIADVDRTWPAWILAVGIVKLLQSNASRNRPQTLPTAPSPAVPPVAPPPAESGPVPNSGEVRNV